MSQTPDEGFAPQYSEQQTRHIIETYNVNPDRYSDDEKESIRHHAVHHRVPFYEGEASISDAIKQAAGGFVEGFTTLNLLGVDPPDNSMSSIARDLGHLAGFAPGILAKPLQLMGLTRAAIGATALREASVPMWGARKATDLAKKYVGTAVNTAYGKRALTTAESAKGLLTVDKVANMAEGAFHLGTASAISSWQEGVDGMMHAFVGGATAGAFFKGMGDFVDTGSKTFDVQMRTLAGSLFMGLPATQRGATDAEQIYQYLMGAYFGGSEMSWAKRHAVKHMKKVQKKAKEDLKFRVLMDPKVVEGYKELPEPVKEEVNIMFDKTFGDRNTRLAMAWELMDGLGITNEIKRAELGTELVDTGKIVHGEQTYRLTREGIETGKPVFKFTGISG